jgi:Galactose oxidase-like, Early set domain
VETHPPPSENRPLDQDTAIPDTPEAAALDSVVLMRNSAVTHLVDGDQRAVKLPVVRRTPGAVFVKAPPRPEVAPSGPYLLFLNQKVNGRTVPSVGHQMTLAG